MQDATEATINLTEAQKQYAELNDIGNMGYGDTIEQEQMDKLLELNPVLSTYFDRMADGTYMLSEKAADF